MNKFEKVTGYEVNLPVRATKHSEWILKRSNNMKIYHTETQEDYNALMEELESDGVCWKNGVRATGNKVWDWFEKETCVKVDDKVLTYADIVYLKSKHPDIRIIEYTAKKTRVERNSVKDLVKEASKDDKEMYHAIIQELEQMYITKNADYGNSFGQSLDEFGEIAGIVMVGEKLNRIKNLTDKQPNVKSESKINALVDMTNDCVMMISWLMKQANE